MASLESYAQTVDTVLLGSLDYKLPAGASYIIDRKSSQFFTSAAGSFGPDFVRSFRINLTSETGFCDLSTVSLSCRIKNTSPTADNIADGGNVYRVYPKTGPWGFIYRLQVLAAGQPVSDILNYGRLHQMFHLLSPKDWKAQHVQDYTFGHDTDASKDAKLSLCQAV